MHCLRTTIRSGCGEAVVIWLSVGVQVATRADVVVLHDGNENEIAVVVVTVDEDVREVVNAGDGMMCLVVIIDFLHEVSYLSHDS